MAPDRNKDKDRDRPRDEYEVAYYTKELGRPLQRKMLQRKLNELADSGGRASHGDEAKPESDVPLPREDRAG